MHTASYRSQLHLARRLSPLTCCTPAGAPEVSRPAGAKALLSGGAGALTCSRTDTAEVFSGLVRVWEAAGNRIPKSSPTRWKAWNVVVVCVDAVAGQAGLVSHARCAWRLAW